MERVESKNYDEKQKLQKGKLAISLS